MDLYFIRHAAPESQSDSLSILGHEQANRLAAALKSLKVDEIYKSPAGVAQQTSSYSEKKCKLPALTVDWIRELAWGDLNNTLKNPISPWVKTAKIIREEKSLPMGDAWKTHPLFVNDVIVDEVRKRTLALDNFLEAHGYLRDGPFYNAVNPNDKQIVFFCHAGIAIACLSHMLNIPFLQAVAHSEIKTASITRVHLPKISGHHTALLSCLNNTSHLK